MGRKPKQLFGTIPCEKCYVVRFSFFVSREIRSSFNGDICSLRLLHNCKAALELHIDSPSARTVALQDWSCGCSSLGIWLSCRVASCRLSRSLIVGYISPDLDHFSIAWELLRISACFMVPHDSAQRPGSAFGLLIWRSVGSNVGSLGTHQGLFTF